MEEQAGAIGILGRTQRLQALGQLLAGGEGGGIVLTAEDLVGGLHQGGGAIDILQRGQAQAGQAQQVLGFGQAPVLTTGTEHGLQALIEQLLIALQLGQQATTIFQFVHAGQLPQTVIQLLVALPQRLRLTTHLLQLLQLLLLIGLHRLHLPQPPTTGSSAGRTQQQGENRQTAAT